MANLDQRLVEIVPSERQLAFQQLEFYSFVHFTMNTFTGEEWGSGKEDPQLFNPKRLDAKQWANACKSAGMRGLILTCKHHDGFCLWPSKYTEHTIARSPYKGGKGDVVRETAEACREVGIKFGIYLSPWDRNNRAYGQGKVYDDYFINQLTELLTQYGDIFSVWFDGACGEGQNGRRQAYDWERYYAKIRQLQPMACINVCGPDIRWCGNEAGHTRKSEWSVVPKRTMDTEKIAENSQKIDESEFRQREIRADDQDLGSRKVLQNETDFIWYPAEVNTSIRPGWFYHDSEDDKVRSLDELIHIYYNSVGGNATFLLNIPPNREGLFHENDCRRLKEIGDYLCKSFKDNLLDSAKLSVDTEVSENDIEQVREDNYNGYFKPKDGTNKCVIEASWNISQNIRHIVLKENITMSQRIEAFTIEAVNGDKAEEIYSGTVVGYKRIIPLAVKAEKIRICISDSRVAPTLSFVGIY